MNFNQLINQVLGAAKQYGDKAAQSDTLTKLGGGAAAAGLLLLLFLLGKRKNSAVAPVVGAIDQDDQDEDDLDISIEDHVFPAATAPQPQPQVVAETSKPEEDGLEIEDDFDDEVFFNETLEPTEITRLLDDKVFIIFKRNDKVVELKV